MRTFHTFGSPRRVPGRVEGRDLRRRLRMAAGACLALAAVASAQEQPPRFTSAVEVTSLDVTVIDSDGNPVPNLTPADFRVRVDGRDRKVVTADWVPLVTEANAAAPIPEGYSSNENMMGGRLFVIVVDQPNIRFGGGLAVARAASAFIDRLEPADRVAVVGLGLGGPSTTFTSDRERIKLVLSRLNGQRRANAPMTYHISLAEAQAIQQGQLFVLEQVLARECAVYVTLGNPAGESACRSEVEMEAEDLGRSLLTEGDLTLRGIRELLVGLRSVPAPKTLILISEGFPLEDSAFTIEAGALAAAAQTSVYALRLDESLFDSMMRSKAPNLLSDRETLSAGLETLVAAARGTLFSVSGTGAEFFDRLETELSGYYLLGVESDPRDRDGKPHPIRVDVSRRGTTVRARRQHVNLETGMPASAKSPRDAVVDGLRMPLQLSALPLRVASFALKGPEQDRVQLLIHADIGADYASARAVTLGYLLLDHEGRLVDSRASDAQLAPVMSGVPSPLQFTMGASVAPGEYTLKLAVAEGDRIGTVEHAIEASVTDVDGVGLSALMVGGPTMIRELLQPTIGYTASFGSVHGYLEAYGPRSGTVSVTYEVATAEDAPALLSAETPARRAGDARALFSRVIPVQQLPAGPYVMRAIVSDAGKPVKTLARWFEVAPPPVLMTSAEGVGASPAGETELYLPVADDLLAQPFDRDHAIAAGTIEAFRSHVPASAQASFDAGFGFIVAGDFPKAEAALKQAIQPEFDSTAALSYLAVCFAAVGRDDEAAGAWQSALAEGGEIPQLYDWLGDALMRMHDLTAARSVYEEAIAKWPAEARFAKPLAMIYASVGRGREAVLTLERYLAANQDDRDALFMAVQWLYHVRAAGGAVHAPAQDLELARTYAAAYEQAGGPQTALVAQWIAYLQK